MRFFPQTYCIGLNSVCFSKFTSGMNYSEVQIVYNCGSNGLAMYVFIAEFSYK
jgi:hypothetical protein